MTATTRLTLVWIAISALTALSYWTGAAHGHGGFSANVPITLGVLVMASIKVRFVLQDFMEVRTAPLWLKLWTDVWLVSLFVGVLVIYLTTTTTPP